MTRCDAQSPCGHCVSATQHSFIFAQLRKEARASRCYTAHESVGAPVGLGVCSGSQGREGLNLGRLSSGSLAPGSLVLGSPVSTEVRSTNGPKSHDPILWPRFAEVGLPREGQPCRRPPGVGRPTALPKKSPVSQRL